MSAVLKEKMIGGMSEARLEFHFDNWRRWMRRDSVGDGYPSKAAGCVGGGYSRTFDEMVDDADIRVAQIVDALVNSLTYAERSAVCHKYLYSRFNFPTKDYDKALERGRYRVAVWLSARVGY